MRHDPFVAIAERVAPGARLARCWPLTGGVSAAVEALELELPEGRRRVVVRRPGVAGAKASGADAAFEFALLGALHAAGLPVPEPLLLDETGELLPEPFLVTAFVDGSTTVDAGQLPIALAQMATFLARLHATDPATLGVALPMREDPVAGALAYLPATATLAREALGGLEPRAANAPALLHGDFWPGNVLWRDGAIAAVLDWEDAALGDPLCDLAGARVELLWRHGEAAMDTFTEQYLARARVDPEQLPVWELFVGSAGAAHMHQWGLATAIEAEMRRRTDRFLEAAARRLAGG